MRSTALAVAVGIALATFSDIACAQSQPPGGGQLLQQLTLPPPPAPADKPALSIEEPGSARATSTTPIPVKRIHIKGNTLIPEARLHELVASAEGKTLTLGELQEVAAQITYLYRKRGYPLARAYVPAQSVQEGEITFAVIEARYGKITLKNQSTTSDRPLRATLAPLESGSAVNDWTLDRSLLLLSDVTGVIVNSTVRPGEQTGTSDLQVDATSGPRYSGIVALDDFGNRYTGRARATVTLNINSLLHQGDRLDFNALSSGSGMTYGEVGYRYLLNGQGTTATASASELHYHLNGSLSDLEAHGTAQVESLNLTHPFIRNTAGNLYGQVQFDHKVLHDDIDLASIRTDRHTNGWMAVIAGDRRDDYGVSNFNFSAAVGRVTFDDDMARIADQSEADTQGRDAHYNLTLARLQQLDPVDGLYLAFTGQLASKNLDPADQFYLGGPSNARGYDVGALTGAQGDLFTLEWRRALPIPLRGAWLASLFADRGHIQVYKDTFVPGPNSASLSDVGTSLHWDGWREWSVSAQLATHVGPSSPLLHSNVGARFWLQVQKGFYSHGG
jgi:hemolysin activation/secretion protein